MNFINSNILTNYFRFTPFIYKLGLIKILRVRAYQINNTTRVIFIRLEQQGMWNIRHFYKLRYVGYHSSYTGR